MLLGYARISTDQQNLDRQIKILSDYGCKKIVTDTITGTNFDREGLNKLLKGITQGDTIVVVELDRLGRSLIEILGTIERINSKGGNFISLAQGFDTRTDYGKLIYSICGAFAEYERKLSLQKSKQGIAIAKQKGVKFGRKQKLDKAQLELFKELIKTGKTRREICSAFKISKASFYRYLSKI